MESIDFAHFDFIIIAIISISGVIAFFRGFIQESLSLLLWIFAFALTMLLDGYLDPYLSELINNAELKRMLSLILIFVGVIFIGSFLIKVLRGLIHWSGMGGLDRLLGVLFGLLRGAILIIIIFLVLPENIKQSEFIIHSKSAPFLNEFAPKIEIFFKNMISNKNSAMLDRNIAPIKKT